MEWSSPTHSTDDEEQQRGAGTRTATQSRDKDGGVDQSLPTLSTDDAERG